MMKDSGLDLAVARAAWAIIAIFEQQHQSPTEERRERRDDDIFCAGGAWGGELERHCIWAIVCASHTPSQPTKLESTLLFPILRRRYHASCPRPPCRAGSLVEVWPGHSQIVLPDYSPG